MTKTVIAFKGETTNFWLESQSDVVVSDWGGMSEPDDLAAYQRRHAA